VKTIAMKKILIVLSLFITGIISGQIVTIPDANFKAALLPIADTNNDGEIQVSEAEALQIMDVQSQNIASMEGIQSFVNLTTLYCFSNDLTELDLTQNVSLIDLWIGQNDLTEIDLSQNVNLVNFDCGVSLISNFDFTHNLNLVSIYIYFNNVVTSLDVSLNQALEELNYSNGVLTNLITQNPNLRSLVCTSNQLETIDISQNPNLEYLDLSDNSLTELDVTQNPNLEELFIPFNSLNAIDISQNPNLSWLSCSYNEIVTLDLSLSPNLFYLNCTYNNLTELDFTNNPSINTVSLEHNLITDLDLSGNPMLYSLWFNDNQLVSLNVQNGNNAALSLLFTFANPSLTCIQVDDPIAANNYPSWAKDITAVYSLDCALGIDDSEIVQAVIYPNPVRDLLTIESKESIESIQIYSILGELIASEMGVSQIDFSSYAKGVYFLKVDSKKGSVFQKVMKE
jgi:hypothetical protein